MYAKIRINGDILVKTGMHIGGSSAFAAIGAVDSPIVRDVRSNLPLLPGSSLKGKMRSLLAKEFMKVFRIQIMIMKELYVYLVQLRRET